VKLLTPFLILALMTPGLAADESDQDVSEATVGQPAPPLEATTIDGKTFRLHDVLKEKRRHAVLIFSRANW
jgi:hypothetical protein